MQFTDEFELQLQHVKKVVIRHNTCKNHVECTFYSVVYHPFYQKVRVFLRLAVVAILEDFVTDSNSILLFYFSMVLLLSIFMSGRFSLGFNRAVETFRMNLPVAGVIFHFALIAGNIFIAKILPAFFVMSHIFNKANLAALLVLNLLIFTPIRLLALILTFLLYFLHIELFISLEKQSLFILVEFLILSIAYVDFYEKNSLFERRLFTNLIHYVLYFGSILFAIISCLKTLFSYNKIKYILISNFDANISLGVLLCLVVLELIVLFLVYMDMLQKNALLLVVFPLIFFTFFAWNSLNPLIYAPCIVLMLESLQNPRHQIYKPGVGYIEVYKSLI